MIYFVLVLYIIIMFLFFFIARKFKIFDSWCEYEFEKAPCYTFTSVLWPLGIIGFIFTILYKITE